jgi:hypothetical protein
LVPIPSEWNQWGQERSTDRPKPAGRLLEQPIPKNEGQSYDQQQAKPKPVLAQPLGKQRPEIKSGGGGG